jgi:hypothetical protein
MLFRQSKRKFAGTPFSLQFLSLQLMTASPPQTSDEEHEDNSARTHTKTQNVNWGRNRLKFKPPKILRRVDW